MSKQTDELRAYRVEVTYTARDTHVVLARSEREACDLAASLKEDPIDETVTEGPMSAEQTLYVIDREGPCVPDDLERLDDSSLAARVLNIKPVEPSHYKDCAPDGWTWHDEVVLDGPNVRGTDGSGELRAAAWIYEGVRWIVLAGEGRTGKTGVTVSFAGPGRWQYASAGHVALCWREEVARDQIRGVFAALDSLVRSPEGAALERAMLGEQPLPEKAGAFIDFLDAMAKLNAMKAGGCMGLWEAIAAERKGDS